jgi:hypothetical protein
MERKLKGRVPAHNVGDSDHGVVNHDGGAVDGDEGGDARAEGDEALTVRETGREDSVVEDVVLEDLSKNTSYE